MLANQKTSGLLDNYSHAFRSLSPLGGLYTVQLFGGGGGALCPLFGVEVSAPLKSSIMA